LTDTEKTSNPGPRIDPKIRARRIEVRRKAARRRLTRLGAVGILIAMVVLAVAATRSPFLDVDRIEVVGADQSGVDTVVAASGVHTGDRMTGVPLGRVAARIRRLPWVATATVRRSWPGTIAITVKERVAVAAIPKVGGGFVYLDATTWEAGSGTALSPHTVLLDVAAVTPALGQRGPAALDPLVAVAASLPAPMGDRLLGLRPVSEASGGAAPGATGEVEGIVKLVGDTTATVRFGPPDQLARKWLALLTVLDQVDLNGVVTIDVRVPAAPAITRR
jgi:cell division protein FtsQ